MRVTRKMCENMIANLNRRLGRPAEPWTKDAAGQLKANVGHIGLDIHSPGDGVTRYHVYEMLDRGGENNLRNAACLGTSELYEFLCGIEVGLDLGKKQ